MPMWTQMQMQMLVTGRKWVDYIAYNPNFEESMIVIRVEADSTKQGAIKVGLETGKRMIEDIKSKME